MHSESKHKPVIVMGGNGRVGREVVSYLLRHTSQPLIVASRSGLLDNVPKNPRVSSLALNAFEPDSLRDGLRGAALVIACIGPSGLVGDRVARACCDIGVPLIDAGGYDPLLTALQLHQRSNPVEVPLIISVGLMPGLTGLFPKYVVEQTADGQTPERLDMYCVARDAWTYNSAWDIVHSLGDFGQDRGLALIRDGQHQKVGLFKAGRKVDFGAPVGRVTTLLMPSEELARLARQLRIPEVRAYGSNVGPRAAISCLRAKLLGDFRTPERIHSAAQRLAKASARDLQKLPPAYALKVEVTYPDARIESASLTITDTYRATGVSIAIAACCLLQGRAIANGVQMLHEAMDARHFMQLLNAEGLCAFSGPVTPQTAGWQGELS